MANLAALLVLGVVGTAVVWAGSTRLEAATQTLADHYGLPPGVQGAVIAAIGSSFPELSSVVLATLLHGEFALGVGAIVGSAVFNILVIPALAALISDGTLDSDRGVVYKEAQFYLLSVTVLFFVFALAVIYFPTGTLQGEVTRPLALVPLALYTLYLFIQYLDTADHRAANGHVREGHRLREWLTLLGSIALILVGVEALVRSAIGLGEAFGTPAFLWGLTVVAAGTSLPDAVVSVVAAKGGDDEVSLTNVLGSNVFDLLVAVPIGVLLAGATVIDFDVVTPMMGFLVVATVAFFTLARTDLELTEREAGTLLTLYGVFVVWLVGESFGLVSLVG